MTALRRVRAAGAPAYTLVLPASWRVADLSAAPGAEAAAIAGEWAPGLAAPARTTFVAAMARELERAEILGAQVVALLPGTQEEPFGCSMLVRPLPNQRATATSVEVEWRAAGRQCERRATPVGPAVSTTQLVRADLLGGRRLVWEMLVAVPALGGGALFAFSSPVVAVAEELGEVGLAIVATLRWETAEVLVR